MGKKTLAIAEDEECLDSFAFDGENGTQQYNSKYDFSTKVSCHNCGRTASGLHLLSSLVSRKGTKAYVFCTKCGRPDNLKDFVRHKERTKQLQLSLF